MSSSASDSHSTPVRGDNNNNNNNNNNSNSSNNSSIDNHNNNNNNNNTDAHQHTHRHTQADDVEDQHHLHHNNEDEIDTFFGNTQQQQQQEQERERGGERAREGEVEGETRAVTRLRDEVARQSQWPVPHRAYEGGEVTFGLNRNSVINRTRVKELTESSSDGFDPQNLPWTELHGTRLDHRSSRIRRYYTFQELQYRPSDLISGRRRTNSMAACFFEFNSMCLNFPSPRVYHHQLRHCVSVTGKDQVYFCRGQVGLGEVFHYNATTHESFEVRDVVHDRDGAPVSLDAAYGLLVLGGMRGGVALYDLEHLRMLDRLAIEGAESNIVNLVTLLQLDEGSVDVLSCNNDHGLRVHRITPTGMVPIFEQAFEECVNHASLSPDRKLFCVGLDTKEPEIVSFDGTKIAKLSGHLDFVFSTAWVPNANGGPSYLVATGAQDESVRVWDIRNTRHSLHTLPCRMAGARSLRFSDRFLAVCEDADFVSLFDWRRDFRFRQDIDFFGEIAGAAFSESGDQLFVGISGADHDQHIAGLLQYRELDESLRLSFLRKGFDYLLPENSLWLNSEMDETLWVL